MLHIKYIPQNRLFLALKNTREKCDEVRMKVKAVKPIFVKIINVMERTAVRTVLLRL